MKGILEISFGGWIREVMVEYHEPHRTDGWETFWLCPKLNTENDVTAFGRGKYQFISNRPLLRQKKDQSRPDYRLTKGEIKNLRHLETIIFALDAWVMKNIEHHNR